MHRRNFIGAGLASALGCLLPWRRAKAAPAPKPEQFTVEVTADMAPVRKALRDMHEKLVPAERTVTVIDPKAWHRLHRGKQLYLNGENVNLNAFLYCPEEGWALCMVRDAQGKPVIAGHDVLKVIRRGHFEIR